MKIDWYPNGKQLVRNILAGKSVELRHAFSWFHSPEGHEYWSSVWYDIRAGKPLPDEARAKLVAMLLVGD